MSKINYVCATCGQDFTRRCSANRHNNRFHFGNGIIVRTLEYIIGRINGQFLPPPNNNNNLSTKIIRKWWHNKHNSSPFTGNNNGLRGSDGRFTTIPDQKGDIFGCGTVGQSVKSNNVSIDNSKIASPYTSILHCNHHHRYPTNQLRQNSLISSGNFNKEYQNLQRLKRY